MHSGDSCTTVWISLVPTSCPLKCGPHSKLCFVYVHFISHSVYIYIVLFVFIYCVCVFCYRCGGCVSFTTIFFKLGRNPRVGGQVGGSEGRLQPKQLQPAGLFWRHRGHVSGSRVRRRQWQRDGPCGCLAGDTSPAKCQLGWMQDRPPPPACSVGPPLQRPGLATVKGTGSAWVRCPPAAVEVGRRHSCRHELFCHVRKETWEGMFSSKFSEAFPGLYNFK